MFIITRVLAILYARKYPTRLDEVLTELEKLDHTKRTFWDDYNLYFGVCTYNVQHQWDKMNASFIAKGFNLTFCVGHTKNKELVNITIYRFRRQRNADNLRTDITVYRRDFKRINKILTGSWGVDNTELNTLLKIATDINKKNHA